MIKALEGVLTLKELGAQLEQVRHASRMSLRDASSAARGTPSHVTIRDWERGLRWPRRDHFTDLLSLAYELSPTHIAAWLAALERVPHPTASGRSPFVVHGRPPALAAAHQPRPQLVDAVKQAWEAGAPLHGTLVALVGPGGVGKTQLASSIFSDVTEPARLRIWVDASSRDTVVSSLAYAAQLTPELNGFTAATPAEWAQHCLYWLANTSEPWMLVLDNLLDFTVLDAIPDPHGEGGASRASLWPSGQGRILITTRYRGPRATAMGVRLVSVTGFTASESKAYLASRLAPAVVGTGALPRNALSGIDALCHQLHHYPLALAHAGASIEAMGFTCKDYLDTVVTSSAKEHRAAWQDEDLAPHYGGAVGSTWELAASIANNLHPQGIAVPALHLASVLDPEGVPDAFWSTPEALAYLQRHATVPGATVTPADARVALRLLHQLSLVEHAPEGGASALRVHAYTQLPVRASMEREPSSTSEHKTLLEETIATAAQALMGTWPDSELNLEHGARLRANVAALRSHGSPVLWFDDPSTVLLKEGLSRFFEGRYVQATATLRELAETSERLVGAHHPTTLVARTYEMAARGWAGEYETAGRLLLDAVPALAERLGVQHDEVGRCRFNAALFLFEAGHVDEARALLADVFFAQQQSLTPAQPDFNDQHRMALVTMHMLPSPAMFDMYRALVNALPQLPERECPLNLLSCDIVYTGMSSPDAWPTMLSILEEAHAQVAAQHPPAHSATMALASAVGFFSRQCGNLDVAEQQTSELLDLVVELRGEDHWDALWCRLELTEVALARGDYSRAMDLLTRLLPLVRRTFGDDHPRTLWCRAEQALCHLQLGKGNVESAQRALAAVVEDYEAVRGPHHPETLVRRRQARVMAPTLVEVG